MRSKDKTTTMVVALSLLAAGFVAFIVHDYRALGERGRARSEAMEQIRQHVLREYPGEMVNARVAAWHGRTLYRIQMADEHGGRTWLSFDVDTGERVTPKF